MKAAAPLTLDSPHTAPEPPGSPEFRLTVIGDVRVEYRVRLSDREFTQLTSSHLEFAPVAPMISGTAVNMARSARHIFDHIGVICRIGDDEFTPTILKHFEDSSISVNAPITHGMRNGIVLIVRDQLSSRPGGVRLLVSGTPTPHAHLSPQDVQDASTLIKNADVVFADSYGLLETHSRGAIAKAQAIARRFDIPFCLDLVPHDIDRRADWDLIATALRSSDIVSVSASTLARLLGLPTTPITPDTLRSIAQLACSAFGQRILWLVSFGAGDMSTMARLQSGVLQTWYDTGYAESDGSNFGDRLVAIELHRLIASSKE